MYIMLIFHSSCCHFYKCLFFYFLDNMNKLYPVPIVESNNKNLSNLNSLSAGGAVSHETFCRHDGRCWTQRGLWGKQGASFSRSLTGSYLLQISIFFYIKLTTKKIYTKIFYLMPTSEQKKEATCFCVCKQNLSFCWYSRLIRLTLTVHGKDAHFWYL